MKRMYAVIVGVWFLLSACAAPPQNTVYQASTIDALLAGVYDGDTSCRSLLQQGDFGIGTFDGLDGEMVVLDGQIFQVRADGQVYRPSHDTKTPFATVCHFNPEVTLPVAAGTDFEAIEDMLNEAAPNQNLFYAIKIKGHFRSMKTRSVPSQQKPYPPLREVTKNQPEFTMDDISGTIIGFRCPAYVKGINVPGYHLHFISSDRSKGGHILSFEIAHGQCELDALNQYALTLPVNSPEFAGTDLTRDRSQELQDVERR